MGKKFELIAQMGNHQMVWADGVCRKCKALCVLELLPENEQWGLVMCTKCDWNGITKKVEVA